MNRVLTLCGADPVTDYTANQARAQHVRTHFEDVRDMVLEQYQWNFIAARASIAAHPTAPTFGFLYKYMLPANCMRVWHVVGEKTYPWRVEQDFIVTDNPTPIKVRYGERKTNPGEWSALFRDLVAHKIALRVAPKISEDTNTIEVIRRNLAGLMDQAQEIDALETVGDDPDDEAPDYPWQLEYDR